MIATIATNGQTSSHAGFRISRMLPGAALIDCQGSSFGPLKAIDRADLRPGLVVRMHEHKNEEIVSYVRSGHLRHTDEAGYRQQVGPDRLMVMGAGRGFSHEEAVLNRQNVSMLQVFVRPWCLDLPPRVQFLDLESATSSCWRLLIAEEGCFGMAIVRQNFNMYDVQLAAGDSTQAPERSGYDQLLYVFSGAAEVAGRTLHAHQAAFATGGDRLGAIIARERCDLVLFLVDPR